MQTTQWMRRYSTSNLNLHMYCIWKRKKTEILKPIVWQIQAFSHTQMTDIQGKKRSRQINSVQNVFLEQNNRIIWPLKCIYNQFDDIMQHQCTKYTHTHTHTKSDIWFLNQNRKFTFTFPTICALKKNSIFARFFGWKIMEYVGSFVAQGICTIRFIQNPIFYLKFWKLVNNRQKHYNCTRGRCCYANNVFTHVRAHVHTHKWMYREKENKHKHTFNSKQN